MYFGGSRKQESLPWDWANPLQKNAKPQRGKKSAGEMTTDYVIRFEGGFKTVDEAKYCATGLSRVLEFSLL